MYGHGFDPEVTVATRGSAIITEKSPNTLGNIGIRDVRPFFTLTKGSWQFGANALRIKNWKSVFVVSQPSNRELNFVLVEYRPDLEEQSSIPSVLMIHYCLSNLQSISFPIFGQLVTKIRNYGTSFQISNLIWEFLTSKLLRRSNTDIGHGSWRVLNVFRK